MAGCCMSTGTAGTSTTSRPLTLIRTGRPNFTLPGSIMRGTPPTLVVLDQDHFSGASQEPQAPDHQLLDFEPGDERSRIIFPRSCLNTTFDPYNPVATFSVNYGEIVLQTSELIGRRRRHFSSPLPGLPPTPRGYLRFVSRGVSARQSRGTTQSVLQTGRAVRPPHSPGLEITFGYSRTAAQTDYDES